MKFGRLTVLEIQRKETSAKSRRIYWKCRCDCGNLTVVRGDCLTSGNTTSCGCYNRDKKTALIDNRTKDKLYHVYYGMKQRCNNPNDKQFKHYGGRGIRISEEWNTYEAFRDWAILNGYEENHNLSIERIDVNGDYSPGNCKWIPANRQSCNTRKTIWLEYNGKTMCLNDWAKELNVNKNTLYHWIRDKGMTISEIIKSKCIDYPERE